MKNLEIIKDLEEYLSINGEVLTNDIRESLDFKFRLTLRNVVVQDIDNELYLELGQQLEQQIQAL
jgi:hypothetical protein